MPGNEVKVYRMQTRLVSEVEIIQQQSKNEVVQVGCEIFLIESALEKYLCSKKMPTLQQEKLEPGLKGAFIREVP